MNPYAAKLYIDGSCYKNPGGPGGFAGIFAMPEDENDPVIIFQEGYKSTTNNRMEIKALISALKYIKKNTLIFRTNNVNEVEIWSDSENTIKCYQCADDWRSENWIGGYGNPIKNIDLLKQILTLKNSVNFTYTLHWIANKSTKEAMKVDELAKKAAKKPFLKDDTGYIKPKVSKTSVKGATNYFNAKGQKTIIRIFGHTPISRRKDTMYNVKFEILAENGNEKYSAFTVKDVNKILDRWHYYNAQFNSSLKNPCILSVEEVEEAEFLAQFD